jgi:aspartate racemase
MKKLGVIGGMSPESTILFYGEMVEILQKRFGAKFDSDYPEMMISNLPIPDIVKGIANERKTREMLSENARKLENAGMDFIAVPCNSVHLFYDAVSDKVAIPVLNIIDVTLKKAKSSGYKRIGLLATETTYQKNLYGALADEYGMEIIMPDENGIKRIVSVIVNLMSGKKLAEDSETLTEVSESLIKRGAECVVLGCTDLPALVSGNEISVPVLDTIKILAEVTVDFALKGGDAA